MSQENFIKYVQFYENCNFLYIAFHDQRDKIRIKRNSLEKIESLQKKIPKDFIPNIFFVIIYQANKQTNKERESIINEQYYLKILNFKKYLVCKIEIGDLGIKILNKSFQKISKMICIKWVEFINYITIQITESQNTIFNEEQNNSQFKKYYQLLFKIIQIFSVKFPNENLIGILNQSLEKIFKLLNISIIELFPYLLIFIIQQKTRKNLSDSEFDKHHILKMKKFIDRKRSVLKNNINISLYPSYDFSTKINQVEILDLDKFRNNASKLLFNLLNGIIDNNEINDFKKNLFPVDDNLIYVNYIDNNNNNSIIKFSLLKLIKNHIQRINFNNYEIFDINNNKVILNKNIVNDLINVPENKLLYLCYDNESNDICLINLDLLKNFNGNLNDIIETENNKKIKFNNIRIKKSNIITKLPPQPEEEKLINKKINDLKKKLNSKIPYSEFVEIKTNENSNNFIINEYFNLINKNSDENETKYIIKDIYNQEIIIKKELKAIDPNNSYLNILISDTQKKYFVNKNILKKIIENYNILNPEITLKDIITKENFNVDPINIIILSLNPKDIIFNKITFENLKKNIKIRRMLIYKVEK